jgi:hypothetical protein
MANSYLSKTPNASNRKTYTISLWLKRSALGVSSPYQAHPIFTAYESPFTSSSGEILLHFDGDDTLHFRQWNGSSPYVLLLITYKKFKDTTSWYHIVASVDTTQATDSNRIKLYANGELLTLATAGYPSQDYDTRFNANVQHTIGTGTDGTQKFFDGQMAHFHFVDGTALTPSTFGETDSTTGEWKPKLNPSVTYGTNGFFLKFENSGALGTDSSGNSNTYAVNGDLKQSISTPSNLFATFNYIHNGVGQQNVISKAGTQIDHTNDSYNWRTTAASLGMNKGKWYWETKYSTEAGYLNVGFGRNGSDDLTQNMRGSNQLGNDSDGNSWAFSAGNTSGNKIAKLIHDNNVAVADMGVTPANGDIIQCWLDLDNGKAWWGVNGTVMNSGSGVGVPNTGANPHFTFTVGDEFYIPAVGLFGLGAPQCQVNFGEGRFGTTAVSSGVADNGGNGTFEYSPLAGFYSVCTKNIKDYG